MRVPIRTDWPAFSDRLAITRRRRPGLCSCVPDSPSKLLADSNRHELPRRVKEPRDAGDNRGAATWRSVRLRRPRGVAVYRLEKETRRFLPTPDRLTGPVPTLRERPRLDCSNV